MIVIRSLSIIDGLDLSCWLLIEIAIKIPALIWLFWKDILDRLIGHGWLLWLGLAVGLAGMWTFSYILILDKYGRYKSLIIGSWKMFDFFIYNNQKFQNIII